MHGTVWLVSLVNDPNLFSRLREIPSWSCASAQSWRRRCRWLPLARAIGLLSRSLDELSCAYRLTPDADEKSNFMDVAVGVRALLDRLITE